MSRSWRSDTNEILPLGCTQQRGTFNHGQRLNPAHEDHDFERLFGKYTIAGCGVTFNFAASIPGISEDRGNRDLFTIFPHMPVDYRPSNGKLLYNSGFL